MKTEATVLRLDHTELRLDAKGNQQLPGAAPQLTPAELKALGELLKILPALLELLKRHEASATPAPPPAPATPGDRPRPAPAPAPQRTDAREGAGYSAHRAIVAHAREVHRGRPSEDATREDAKDPFDDGSPFRSAHRAIVKNAENVRRGS